MNAPASAAPEAALTPDEFDELDAILDDLRARHDGIPQWEFCEGFMAALACCRRAIEPAEYFPVLWGERSGDGLFADAAQQERFGGLWARRWREVAAALDNEAVESLDDPACYHPEVMDVRGVVAGLSEAERAELGDEALPSYGQVWAMGFMYAVESWPQEWRPPRDRETAEWLEESLACIEALTLDDAGTPEVSGLGEDAPPSMSRERVEDFGAAIWAVYDLRELWRSLGPRVETVRRQAAPGRNDACPCGSGRKYKKCCGAQ